MAVAIPDAPELGLALVREHVPLLLESTDEAFTEKSVSMRVARPYPLYTSTLPNLLEKRLLACACLTAWQYVVYSEEAAIGVAEVSVETEPGEPAMAYAAFESERYADMVLKGMINANELIDREGGDYELRILRAPSLTLLAVWLHGNRDLLLPIHPVHDFIKKRRTRLITEEDLTESLRPLALTRLHRRDG